MNAHNVSKIEFISRKEISTEKHQKIILMRKTTLAIFLT